MNQFSLTDFDLPRPPRPSARRPRATTSQAKDVQFSPSSELINILVITGWAVCLVLNTWRELQSYAALRFSKSIDRQCGGNVSAVSGSQTVISLRDCPRRRRHLSGTAIFSRIETRRDSEPCPPLKDVQCQASRHESLRDENPLRYSGIPE